MKLTLDIGLFIGLSAHAAQLDLAILPTLVAWQWT
jgi:hypothetical protein